MSGDRLVGKVALISGAAGGIGSAAARRFVAEGARVVVGDVRSDEGQEVVGALGDAARFVELDVTSADSWRGAVELTETEFERCDVLVNNAGILSFGSIARTTREEYLRLVEVNQLGVFLGMQAVIEAMVRAGGGSIVNVSSVEGLGGMPYLTAYAATKFAVRGMTKSAALELARKGIRVNSIHPGAIETDMVRTAVGSLGQEDVNPVGEMVPLRRMGQPDEVAAMMVFLASDDSSYCTGGEYTVDGGATASSGFHR